MECLYNKFVEKWNAEFPKEEPPLLDLHGCMKSEDGFESLDIEKINELLSSAKETTTRLRKELKRAEVIEKFWSTLAKDFDGLHVEKSSNLPSRAFQYVDSKSSNQKRFSLLEGLGKCVDSSLENLVNIGLGGDVIDVTDNHQIQINSVVTGDQYLHDVVDSSSDSSHDISLTSTECNKAQVFPPSPDNTGSKRNAKRNIFAQAEFSQLSNESLVDDENETNYRLSAPEKEQSVKPAIPPRRPKSDHGIKSKPPTLPRSFKKNSSIGNVPLQHSDGEPSISKSKVNSVEAPTNVFLAGQNTPETVDEFTGRKSEGQNRTSCHTKDKSTDNSSEDDEKDMRKFKLLGSANKKDRAEVISTGFKRISHDINTLDTSQGETEGDYVEIADFSQQSEKPSGSPVSARSNNRHRNRSNDYENFSVDFLLTRKNPSAIESEIFESEEEDPNSSRGVSEGSGPYDNNLSDSPRKVSDIEISNTDTAREEVFSSPDSQEKTKSNTRFQPGDIPRCETTSTTFNPDKLEEESSPQPTRNDGKYHMTIDQIKSDEEDGHSCDSENEIPRTMSINTSMKIRKEKLNMRKILVKGILESERTYLSILKDITELKRKIQNQITDLRETPMCTMEDVTTIFYRIEEIHVQHNNFVTKLQEKVDNWSDTQKVGDTFKELIVYFPMHMTYVNHNQESQDCLLKCCNANEEFKKLVSVARSSSSGQHSSLQELLFTPVQRLQRNTLVLHDLLKYTPDDHDDYKSLVKTLDLADHNLKNFASPESDVANTEDHLVKSGFVVEMVGHSRKLRFLFLFSDVLVCTKHKQTGRNRVNVFEVKWFLPVPPITFGTKQDKAFQIKEDTESMKKKIVSLKAELRVEIKNHEDPNKERSWLSSGRARVIEKLKKKIEEQEAALILASPHLPLQFKTKEDSKNHCILLSTDYEREEWRDAILAQQHHHHGAFNRQLSGHDIQAMINDSKQLPQVNNIGNVLLRKDDEMLNGSLNVTIHKLNGLESPCDTYVQLHLDSFGYFFMQAKTRPCHNTKDPTWDEDFELELEGSQTLRILCYSKSAEGEDNLIGRSALELSRTWLSSSFKEQKISMNTLSLTISVRHTAVTKTLKRSPSKIQGGIFGAKIATVTNRERKTVPSFVTACIKEVESRGMQEVGIYRISGVTSEIQRIKKTFDKNLRVGLNLLAESDIHAVTGVLKLYFRELPEPLFTEASYTQFMDTLSLHDEDSKEKVFLQLLHDLPNENYYTIIMIVEHLVRVSKFESENKMSLSNLATVFGPTLLHPAVSEGKQTQAQLMQDAQAVFLQAAVLSFLLQVATRKSIRRSESQIEMHGEDRLV